MVTKVRKNGFLRIAGILFLAAMITNIAMTGTLAKYTASATGTSTASIAKFSVSIGSTDIAQSSTVTIDLFKNVMELDNSGNVDSNAELTADVSSGKIAPGTGGKVVISVVNNSDVKVTVTFSSVTATLNGIPLEFSDDNVRWTTTPSAAIGSNSVTLAAGNTTSTEIAELYWRWPFYVSAAKDDADTLLGVAATATATVTLNITATQVD